MTRRSTSFSKLIMTFAVLGVIYIGGRYILSGGANDEVFTTKIKLVAEDQGYTEVTVTKERCIWSCDEESTLRTRKFVAKSTATRRVVSGCACQKYDGSISLHWDGVSQKMTS